MASRSVSDWRCRRYKSQQDVYDSNTYMSWKIIMIVYSRFRLQFTYINLRAVKTSPATQSNSQSPVKRANALSKHACFSSMLSSIRVCHLYLTVLWSREMFLDLGFNGIRGQLPVVWINFAPSQPGDQRSATSTGAMSEWRHRATPVTWRDARPLG